MSKKPPTDPTVRDTYDIGYARKYRELNRWRGTVLPWVCLAACALGIVILFLACATYEKPRGPWEYGSPSGMTAELSADSSHITINDIVFIAPEVDDTTPAYYDALVIIALCLVLGGLLVLFFYFGYRITEKSKEAGWEMVEKVHGKRED